MPARILFLTGIPRYVSKSFIADDTLMYEQLAQLLRDCFVAESKVVLIANVSPRSGDEYANTATLDFASKVSYSFQATVLNRQIS